MSTRHLASARRILGRLDGTLLYDLRSMRQWAAGFDGLPVQAKGLGALNFALALVSLVACEAIGFFTTGASKHKGVRDPRGIDVGAYIIDFIGTFLPRGSKFKPVSKILADSLRHDLAHGFGSRSTDAPFDVGIFVADAPDRQVELGRRGRREVVWINAVALADQVLEAFRTIQGRIVSDAHLVENIRSASRLRFPVPTRVVNQFLTLRPQGSRARGGRRGPRKSKVSVLAPNSCMHLAANPRPLVEGRTGKLGARRR